MIDARTAREQLAALAQPDGGWGYQAGQPMHLEPTCLALLALAADRATHAATIEAGLRALEANRQPDGTYRLVRGRPQAAWTTSLALFARHALGHDPATLKSTADALLAFEGRVVKADAEVGDANIDIDVGLVGWPWSEANFSWVEPTAWACIALRAAGFGDHPRVREGLRLLIDRAFDSGGVNYGNRIILGKPTEPIPGPTALMLLALQGVEGQPRIDAAKGYLRVHAGKTTDLEHLAWAKLALSAHVDDSATRGCLPRIDDHLRGAPNEELQRADGLGTGPYRLALVALALAEPSWQPFQLPPSSAGLGKGDSHLFGGRKDDCPLFQGPPPDRRSLGEKLKSRARGFFVNRLLSKFRPLPPNSAVHVARADSYSLPLAEILAKQFSHFRDTVPIRGKRVVLKPNLVEYHKGKVINTDPRVVEAVIELCQQEGAAEIVVAEGPGHWRNVQFLVKESGLGAVLEKHGIRFVDLNHDEPVKMLNLGRLTGLDYLYLARTVVEAEVFISLPKLKTHHWAGATLSLKNLFGTLPGICYGWPKNELHWRGIPNSIVDIALTRSPHLAIVDGIVGMEGDGPLNGTAKPCGVLVMGADLVAVDATCCRIMQLPPYRLPTLVLAGQKRLGRVAERDIPQLGVPIATVTTPFAWPPKVEEHLLTVEEEARVRG